MLEVLKGIDFTATELFQAVALAKEITVFNEECKNYGPYSTDDGKWYVAKKCCGCGDMLEVERFENYALADKMASQIVRQVIEDEDNYATYTDSNDCSYCTFRRKEVEKLKKRCSGGDCPGDCGYCSTFRAMEELYE